MKLLKQFNLRLNLFLINNLAIIVLSFIVAGCHQSVPIKTDSTPVVEIPHLPIVNVPEFPNIESECKLTPQEINTPIMKLSERPYDVLLVDSASQRAYFKDKEYIISTAKNGLGESKGSYQTPRGWHIIRAKIGDNFPINTIIKARRSIGILTPELLKLKPHSDWILTRVLWLSGCEIGKNRLGDVDSFQRFIYFHGAADRTLFGSPTSKGCVRMKNQDIVELYDLVEAGQKVFIQ